MSDLIYVCVLINLTLSFCEDTTTTLIYIITLYLVLFLKTFHSNYPPIILLPLLKSHSNKHSSPEHHTPLHTPPSPT